MTWLHDALLDAYGPQSWWPAGFALEVILGAILVQNTAWTSARRALDNLQAAGIFSLEAIREAPEAVLADLVRPAGYYNAKARKLQAFAARVDELADGDLDALLARPLAELRPLLLATHGFGPETTDVVLLYAARRPVFVIDAYTRRLVERLGWAAPRLSYETARAAFEAALPPEVERFAQYHALIVLHGKETCRKQPRCDACPLLGDCAFGQARAGLAPVGRDGPLGGRRNARPSPRRTVTDWNA